MDILTAVEVLVRVFGAVNAPRWVWSSNYRSEVVAKEGRRAVTLSLFFQAISAAMVVGFMVLAMRSASQ